MTPAVIEALMEAGQATLGGRWSAPRCSHGAAFAVATGFTAPLFHWVSVTGVVTAVSRERNVSY